MVSRILSIERPGLSAYITASRDGTVRFWSKSTMQHLRCFSHTESVRRHYRRLVQVRPICCGNR
jgi:hypothetical protein